MANSTTHSGRDGQVRPSSTPEPHSEALERVERGLAELKHAPVIRTIAWPFFDVDVELGGES